MRRYSFQSPCSAALAAALLLALPMGARAGLVTGNWDPPFGPALPGLNWAVRANFDVPNACAAQADGVYAVSSGACAGSSTINFNLRLFNGSATSNFFENSANAKAVNLQGLAGANYQIDQIKVFAGQVVGLQVGYLGTFSSPVWTAAWNFLPEAQNDAFGAALGLLGARAECLTCSTFLFSETAGLDQFLVTYDSVDGGYAPKLTDGSGNAAGVGLNDQGVIQGFFAVDALDTAARGAAFKVPEPGALALVSLAMGALAWSRRRRCQIAASGPPSRAGRLARQCRPCSFHRARPCPHSPGPTTLPCSSR